MATVGEIIDDTFFDGRSHGLHWLVNQLTRLSVGKSLTGSRESATVIAVFDAGAED